MMVRELYENRAELKAMGEAARKLAHPGAARRAAEILVEVDSIDSADRVETIVLKCFFHGSISTSRESAESA
jgi:hypothetical protein